MKVKLSISSSAQESKTSNEEVPMTLYHDSKSSRNLRTHRRITQDTTVVKEVNFKLTQMDIGDILQCPKRNGDFPSLGNCSKFYSCRDGRAKQSECPSEELHFNPITKLCDYPAYAQCENKCPQSDGRFPVVSNCANFLECKLGQGTIRKCPGNMHFNAVTKQCTLPSKASCSLMCSQNDGLLPLPGRCNLYVECINRHPITRMCPEGLHFNPIELTCDKPENAQCEPQCLDAEGLFPVLGQCSSYIKCYNHTPKIKLCPSNLHFNVMIRACDVPRNAKCNTECQQPNGFFEIPGICSHYVKCINGFAQLQKCSEGLSFNPEVKQCDLVTKDSCSYHCPLDDGIFPVSNHCTFFLHCRHGQAKVEQCSGNLHYNALIEGCDQPQRAKCQPQCPVPYGLFPLVGKCNMFFSCDDSQPTVHHCPEGLHFNARTSTCDWPSSANCQMSCPMPEGFHHVQGDCGSYVQCSNGKPTLKMCVAGSIFNFKTKLCDTDGNSNSKVMCPQKNGMFPVPGYSDSYIRCVDGLAHMHSCSSGLLYNALNATCDLAKNAHCDK